MTRTIYFDVLDTARTASDAASAADCIVVGSAELKLAVLRGWTPVFPQTYGWDSTALLAYVAQPGFESLLRKGLVRVRLRDAPTVWDAALSAFENPGYMTLGAWPECNGVPDPHDARRPLVEAMRTGHYSADLQESARERLNWLRELSRAVEAAPEGEPEQPRGDRFAGRMRLVADTAYGVNPSIANLLRDCARLPQRNNRTAVSSYLDEQAMAGTAFVPEARAVMQCCFNEAAAETVGAQLRGLTLPVDVSEVAVSVLRAGTGRGSRADIFQSNIRPGQTDFRDLECVTWEHVSRFDGEAKDHSSAARTREAEAAKMIASVAFEDHRRYAVHLDVRSVLAHTGLAAIGHATGAPLELAGTLLVGGLGGLDFGIRSRIEADIRSGLERKWFGVMGGVGDQVAF
jgi:hypothetical protein